MAGSVPTEGPLDKIGSKYKLVIVAAKRALELSEGAPKLIGTDPKRKPSLVSLEEIANGKIGFRAKKQAK